MKLPSLALSLALITALSGCKLGADSKAKSLSAEELKACGVFHGDRLIMTVTPVATFAQDGASALATFAQSMSTTSLAGYSYFSGSDGTLSAACKLYVQTEQAKYRSFLSLSGDGASTVALSQGLANLGREVQRLRAMQAQTADADSYQIQIILAFSSHGGGTLVNPDGLIQLGGSDRMAFTTLSQLIQQNLLTVCDDPACSVLSASQPRKADEVLILMDTCYSGRFNTALQSTLASAPGYKPSSVGQGSRSKATRVLSFSSSGNDQTSPGAFAGTNNGTLYEALNEMIRFWQADGDHNNAISLAETRDYLTGNTVTSNLAFANAALDLLVTPGLVCSSKRAALLPQLNADPAALARFWTDPVATMKKTAIAEIDIAIPTFFTNLREDYLKTLLIAVGGQDAAAAGSAPSITDLEAALKLRAGLLQKLYAFATHTTADFNMTSPGITLTAAEQSLLSQQTISCTGGSGGSGSYSGGSSSVPVPPTGASSSEAPAATPSPQP